MRSTVCSRSQRTLRYVLCIILLSSSLSLCAQTVQVGAGSYTTAVPAGATAPSSQIFNTVPGPKPTHRFWTAKNWYADNIINGSVTFGGGGGGPFVMFPQPLGMQTTSTGLLLGFDATITSGGTFFFQPFEGDLRLGVAGLNTGSVNVSGYSDWTVDFNFGPMTTRVGRGMPFVYVTTNGSNPTITFAGQPTVFANNGNILGVSIANNNYGLFCPSGGSWSGIGSTVLTCNLPSGHDYFSLALLLNAAALSTYSQFAFSFPANTQVAWNYASQRGQSDRLSDGPLPAPVHRVAGQRHQYQLYISFKPGHAQGSAGHRIYHDGCLPRHPALPAQYGKFQQCYSYFVRRYGC